MEVKEDAGYVSEDENETAQEKRLRLAKKYLAQIKSQGADRRPCKMFKTYLPFSRLKPMLVSEADEDADGSQQHDAVSRRIHQELVSLHYNLCISSCSCT